MADVPTIVMSIHSFVGVCVKLTKRFTHNPSPFASAPRGRF